eukprot:GHUV01040650.1.p2 GENE.GHUV01040650.1~~GHUV01040650.1.p2  ORF type:complete len:107 (+),score=10.73 GHUV01040650.1:161-481(+)
MAIGVPGTLNTETWLPRAIVLRLDGTECNTFKTETHRKDTAVSMRGLYDAHKTWYNAAVCRHEQLYLCLGLVGQCCGQKRLVVDCSVTYQVPASSDANQALVELLQ